MASSTPPVSRKKRGAHPQDRRLFSDEQLPALQEAVSDLSWLRTRGYAEKSSIKLVGDRYELTARQRTAVGRCACGDDALESRIARRTPIADVRNRRLLIDGFNLLTTLEAALGGGILMRGRDGCIRDMTSMHGNYRVLTDTQNALEMTFRSLSRIEPESVVWYLDKPVSNSGQLKKLIGETGKKFPGIESTVRLVKDPDPILKKAAEKTDIAVTADSGILDACGNWANLADYVLAIQLPDRELLDFSSQPADIQREPTGDERINSVSGIKRISSETQW